MRAVIIILFTLFVFLACKKDGAIDASKITSTDNVGNQTGTFDPSDWRFDDQWNNKELALFNFADTVNTIGMEQGDILSAIAYPNPATDIINLYFSSNKSTLLKIVITDENLNIIQNYYQKMIKPSSAPATYVFAIDIRDNTKFKPGRYYRVYYALYSEGQVLYKQGHGDFKKS